MTEDRHTDILLDLVHRAVHAPETVTDAEREQWADDPEFLAMLETAMAVKLVHVSATHTDVDSREAFRAFAEAHRDGQAKPKLVVRLVLLMAAACLAGWWLLPSLLHRPTVETERNAIYLAAHNTAAEVTISDGQTRYTPAQLAQADGVRTAPVVMAGDTIICLPRYLDGQPAQQSTITVPQGHTAMLVLPDGTRVWLNTESHLVYPEAFTPGQPRLVELRGEAFFEVARDERSPFIVRCDDLHTTVLGTSFNVRNYPESAPCVTLVSGSVHVDSRQQQLTLQPSQSATMERSGRLTTTTADLESVLCWRDGLFFFDGKTLREVLLEMGRWYDVDVVVNDDAHINDRLHFRGERSWLLPELVESINIICDVDLQFVDGALVLN